MARRRKITPLGVAVGAAIFPALVLKELVNNPRYQTKPQKRRRR